MINMRNCWNGLAAASIQSRVDTRLSIDNCRRNFARLGRQRPSASRRNDRNGPTGEAPDLAGRVAAEANHIDTLTGNEIEHGMPKSKKDPFREERIHKKPSWAPVPRSVLRVVY
jgi:hypothetical protein